MTEETVTGGVLTARLFTWPIDDAAYEATPHTRENGPWRTNQWRPEDLANWTTWSHINPEVVRCVWRAVEALGFRSGRVLDCSGGGSAFTAMAPPGAAVTRVEPLAGNARWAAKLFPHADVWWADSPRRICPTITSTSSSAASPSEAGTPTTPN